MGNTNYLHLSEAILAIDGFLVAIDDSQSLLSNS
jgi:hypothetical protein